MDDNEVDCMPLFGLRMLPRLLVLWRLCEPGVADGGAVHAQKGQKLLSSVVALTKSTRSAHVRPLIRVSRSRPHARVEVA